MGRTKPLWLLIILLGFGELALNWTTGTIYYDMVALEIFSVGAGKPSGVPRPVVNSSTVAPAAARAVLETASLPGDSSSAKPGRRIRSP